MNRKLVFQLISYLSLFLVLFSVLPATVNSVPPVNQKNIIVDINGKGDYTSIKDAVNNAQPLDAIQVKSGVYIENEIRISKRLSIIGESPDNTVIDFSNKNGIDLASDNVELSNLKLINSNEYSIHLEALNSRCSISNCIIEKPGAGIGIWIDGSSVVISGCDIYGINSGGIGVSIRKTGSIVSKCNISGFDAGIMLLINAINNKIISCNLYNNYKGIDIRIGSNDNLVSNCNIYGNNIGIQIWQSSIDNSVYLNNLWRNSQNAVSENKDTWDNGVKGNYWDDYQGVDDNNDNIGDTPYVISDNNTDRFPLMLLLLPDKITAPNDITLTSDVSDVKPSFTWSRPLYGKEIKGYYVKIDNNPETFIGDTTSWTSSNKVSNGTHVFYIRAVGEDNTISSYALLAFFVDASLVDSDGDGIPDVEEVKLGSDPNNPNDVKKIDLGGKSYFLVDINQDESFDILYNHATKVSIALGKEGVSYLIDTNGDGKWEYIYNAADETISTYTYEKEKEQAQPIPILWIFVLIVIIIVIVIFIFYYNIQKMYVKHGMPERTIEESATRFRKPEKIRVEYAPEKQQAVDETITMLKLMREEMKVYMDKLQDMDQRSVLAPVKEKKKLLKEENFEVRDVKDIEFVIDNFILGSGKDSGHDEDVSEEKENKDEEKSEKTKLETVEEQIVSNPEKEEDTEPVKLAKFEVRTLEDIEFGIDNSLFGIDNDYDTPKEKKNKESEKK